MGTGRFYLTVTDVNNCTASASAKVSAPGCDSFEVVLTYYGVGENNNWATASPIKGASPFTYLWSTGATTDTITNLATGVYCITITDAINCSAKVCGGEIVMSITDDEAAGNIKIYPNPARDVLIIEPVKQENALLTILSLEGKVVLTHHLTTAINAISTQGLPNGMYIYTLSSATSPPTLPQKLLINH